MLRSLALLLSVVVAMPAAGAEADDLTAAVTAMARVGRAFSPSFSPDGSQLACVSDLGGVPQVWIVPTTGGFPRLVTAFDDPVTGVQWSPRGEWLALSVAPGGGLNTQIYLVRADGTGLRRLTDGGAENNWLGEWTKNGDFLGIASNRRSADAMDAYLVEASTGSFALVAENPGIGYLTDVSEDNHRAVLFRMRSRGDSDLFLVDIPSHQEIRLTPHTPPAEFEAGVFSRDGRSVYVTSNADRDRVAFGRLTLAAGGTPGPIEILCERDDAELDGFAVDFQGTRAALIWNAGGRAELEFFDLRDGKRSRVEKLPNELLGGVSFSRDGKRVAFVSSGTTAPPDIWVYELQSKKMWQVTHSPHAGVDLSKLIRPELVRFAAHDGLQLSGWLYRPEGMAVPGPVVLSFHGGPEGQERPAFRSDYQALLRSGIAVFAPNVRGSSGFGKEFVNLDNGALRVDGVRDIESCVDYLVGAGIADPRRIGITGGSYGGYMTMAGLTQYPERFAAGANLFGIVNFETFFAHTQPWMAAISTIEYGDPVTQAELLRSLSPIHKLDRIKAPTLVLHGANDTNVPVVEAEQIVESLKKRGVPVEYVLFPDEGHGWRKTTNRITSTVTVTRFFARHLNGEGSAQR